MNFKPTTIYFPEELYQEIKGISEREGRSFNKQVIMLLKRAIGNQNNQGRGERRGYQPQ